MAPSHTQVCPARCLLPAAGPSGFPARARPAPPSAWPAAEPRPRSGLPSKPLSATFSRNVCLNNSLSKTRAPALTLSTERVRNRRPSPGALRPPRYAAGAPHPPSALLGAHRGRPQCPAARPSLPAAPAQRHHPETSVTLPEVELLKMQVHTPAAEQVPGSLRVAQGSRGSLCSPRPAPPPPAPPRGCSAADAAFAERRRLFCKARAYNQRALPDPCPLPPA